MGKLSPTLYRVFLYLFHLLCLTNHVNFWDIFILALPILASKDLPGCQLFWKLGWLFWIIPKAFTYTFRMSSWWNLRLNSFVLRFTFASSCCNSVTGLFSLFLCSVAVKLFFFFFFFTDCVYTLKLQSWATNPCYFYWPFDFGNCKLNYWFFYITFPCFPGINYNYKFHF